MHKTTISLISTDWPQDAIPQKWIEKLFDEMLLTHGKRFTDQWGSVAPKDMKEHWGRRMNTLSNEEMARGVEKMRTLDWPPSLPEFMRLCKPSVDPIIAYYEAVNGVQAREQGEMGEWSHPAIFWASVKVGAFDLKNQSYSQIKARWEKALSDEMEKKEWGQIKLPELALAAPGKTTTDREQATKKLNEIAPDGVLKNTGVDHRRWIQKVLDREKSKDETLPNISVKFAKQAMRGKNEQS